MKATRLWSVVLLSLAIVALAGGTQTSATVSSANDLAREVDSIIQSTGQSIPCSFDLNNATDNLDADRVWVDVDSQPLPESDYQVDEGCPE